MWYKKMAPEERKRKARLWVSNLIPEEPEKIRMGDLIRQAKENFRISAVTVVESVKQGVADGYYERIQESHKEVYYTKTRRKGLVAMMLIVPTLLVPLLEHTGESLAWKKRGEAYVYSSKKETKEGQVELTIRFKPVGPR